MAKPSTRIYTILDTAYLREQLPGYSDERKDTQISIAALLFSSHQKHLIRSNGAVSIPSSIMESHIGMSRELFRSVNKKYGFFDIIEDVKFGISRQLIPTELTKRIVHGLLVQNKAHRLFLCTGRKRKYTRVYTKTETVIQGYLVRNYEQDINQDYSNIVKRIVDSGGLVQDSITPTDVLQYFIELGYEYNHMRSGTDDEIIRFMVERHNVYRDTFKGKSKYKYRYNRRDPFFYSTEWKTLRLEVLEKYGRKCLLCGSEDSIHVDHIFPRSIFPELELDVNNLQPLCHSCNDKKSNKYFWDCRTVSDEAKLALVKKAGYDSTEITKFDNQVQED
ncbi:HNH endonuclease [Sinomicrobium sp.]